VRLQVGVRGHVITATLADPVGLAAEPAGADGEGGIRRAA
jgi:hypothetical protein